VREGGRENVNYIIIIYIYIYNTKEIIKDLIFEYFSFFNYTFLEKDFTSVIVYFFFNIL